MRQHKTSNQDRGADPERTATDPEQLVDFALNGIGMMGEISMECFFQLSRSLRFRLGFGKVNHDRDCATGSQLAGPSDDELFRLPIQVALAERKRIQSMK